jgi:hypothetical protein
MNEERIGKCLRQVEHIRGEYLAVRYQLKCVHQHILCCVEFGLTEISWDKLRQCAVKNFHKLNVFISQMSRTWMK